MIIDIKMTSISLSCYFLGEFLTEIVCHDMCILIDRYISLTNWIQMSSSALWVFSEKSTETDFKQIIVGPIG